MNQSGIVIFGSSRSKGNTFNISQLIAEKARFDLVDLNSLEISPYDYAHGNQTDDFLKLAEEMAEKKVLVLISPVYWYSMSAQMKTFIDRWSDLVTIRKDLGRKLQGVKLFVVSCSGDNNPGEGFALPFSQTAGYMNMDFQAHFHTWKEDGSALTEDVEHIINEVVKRITSD